MRVVVSDGGALSGYVALACVRPRYPAQLRAREDPPVRWEPADAELSVDSASGCLAGPQALAALHTPEPVRVHPLDLLVEALGETECPTWCWANQPVGSAGNVIAFTTGYGDGSYPLSWGLAADGGPACLLVDLRVLDGRHDPDRA